jgi:DNA-binding transcriptional MerR regulator
MNKKLEIEDKKYFSISEVSKILDLKAHTLRFWEKEFKNLNPMTRKGNRRYYQREDILMADKIKSLLQVDGLTISGAKKSLDSSKEALTSTIHSKEILDDLDKILTGLKYS